MTSTISGKPLTVQTAPGTPPFLHLPADQMDQVSQLMTRHQVRHEVTEFVISMGGKPASGYIRFGWDVDPKAVQVLLDAGH